MKKASVRDLRYEFKKIERMLDRGEEIQITKRRRVIARLVPEREETIKAVPDYGSRIRAIYGDQILTVTAAELIALDRRRD